MSRKLIAAASLVVLTVCVAFARQNAPAKGAAAPANALPQVAVTARWLVLFELGAKFDATKRLQEQPGFMEHVTAIKKLADDGALLVGGPLLESFESHKPTGAAWIVQAENEEAVKKLVATDPWVGGDLAKIHSIRAFFAGTGAWLPKTANSAIPGH
jgi:uncharacterized protein YciI